MTRNTIDTSSCGTSDRNLKHMNHLQLKVGLVFKVKCEYTDLGLLPMRKRFSGIGRLSEKKNVQD